MIENGYEYVLCFDLSRFAAINEAVGITGGDVALRLVEKQLVESLGIQKSFRNELLESDRILVRLGGDEYAVMKKKENDDEPISEQQLNAILSPVKVPYLEEPLMDDATTRYRAGSKGRFKPLTPKKERVEMRSVSVVKNDPPQVAIDHTERNPPQYRKHFKVLFGISEDNYNGMSDSMKAFLEESVFDPVFPGKDIFKNPSDAYLYMKQVHGNTDLLVIQSGAIGLKKANTLGKGDEFLRAELGIIQKALEDTIASLRLNNTNITITRNRGSTFTLFIVPVDIQEQFTTVFEELLRFAYSTNDYKIDGVTAIPGSVYTTSFTGKSEEYVQLTDEADVFQLLATISLLSQGRDRRYEAIEKQFSERKSKKNWIFPVKEAAKLQSTDAPNSDNEVFSFLTEYANDSKRSRMRRKVFVQASQIASKFFTFDPSTMQRLRSIDSLFGNTFDTTLVRTPVESRLLHMASIMLGVSISDYDEEDV